MRHSSCLSPSSADFDALGPARVAVIGTMQRPHCEHRHEAHQEKRIVVQFPCLDGGFVATLLCVGKSGTNDPTLASFPFVIAVNAAAAGHQAEIALLGEAAYLMKAAVRDNVHGVGFPPLRDLFAEAVRQNIPIHV